MRKCSELLGRAFPTSRLSGGAIVTKRSPHCLCLSWTAVTSIISFTETSKFLTKVPNCNVKHQEGKHSVCLSRFIWPWNLLAKLTFYGTHLEKHCSRHTQFKPCHTQLWDPLWEFNRSCSVASSWQKASQLTFPAPTGPTTAKSSPGLAIRKRSCRVGVPDFYKLKFIKMWPFQ